MPSQSGCSEAKSGTHRLGVGVANYHDRQSLAVGYSRSVTSKLNVTFGAAVSGDETTAGVGVGMGW